MPDGRALRSLNPAIARLMIAGVGLAFLILYVSTLTAQHTFDSVSYALDIRRFYSGASVINRLFHPHHLLFSSFGLLTHYVVSAVRPGATTLQSLQIFTSIMGAIGLAAFAAWIYEETRSVWAALTAVIVLGATFGWWFGSTDGRANLAATSVLLCGVYALDRAARLHSARRWWVNAGILIGGACLLHQNHGLFLPAALITALATPGSSWAQRRSWALTLFVTFVLTVSIPYSIVVFGILKKNTPAEAIAWMTSYAHQGTWWDLHFVKNLSADGKALVKFFTGFELQQPLKPEDVLWFRIANGSWVILLMTALAGAVFRAAWWRRRAFLLPPFLGLLCYGTFFTLWDPGYFVHWFAFSAFLVAFAALGWLEATPHWSFRALATVLALGLVVSTFFGVIQERMNPERNPFITLAERVDRVADNQDLVITAGMGYGAEAEIYVPYFARVNTIAIHSVWADADGDTQKATEDLRVRIAEVLEKGNRVFILSDAIMDPSALRAMEKRYGVTAEEIRHVFAPFRRNKVEWQGYIVIFELTEKPDPVPAPGPGTGPAPRGAPAPGVAPGGAV